MDEKRDFVRIAAGEPLLFRRIENPEEAARLTALIVSCNLKRKSPGGASSAEATTAFQAELARRLAVIEAKLDFITHLLTDRPSGKEARLSEGRLTDLSGSGLLFQTDFDPSLEVDDLLEIHLSMAGVLGRPIQAVARVQRTGCQPDSVPPIWQTAVVFESIAESDRDQVVAFIFQCQRQALQERWDGDGDK
ncbi:MAG: PilZ domain-containing protein [Deltaproteobacteria bacterium]|nr:PilZ domain-containing protein [Deltaproteobacteria bacterium]